MTRYQVAHAPKLPAAGDYVELRQGPIASVSGIVQTPNSEIVQVKYNRLVPETVQGSLDDPQIRQLLMLGTKLATTNDVHADSVALLASECLAGHQLRWRRRMDRRMAAFARAAGIAALRQEPDGAAEGAEGLQPYVARTEHVRDAVLDALMHDRRVQTCARRRSRCWSRCRRIPVCGRCCGLFRRRM